MRLDLWESGKDDQSLYSHYTSDARVGRPKSQRGLVMEKKSQQKQQQQAEMIPFDAEHEKLMREEFLRRKKLNDNGQFDDVVSGR